MLLHTVTIELDTLNTRDCATLHYQFSQVQWCCSLKTTPKSSLLWSQMRVSLTIKGHFVFRFNRKNYQVLWSHNQRWPLNQMVLKERIYCIQILTEMETKVQMQLHHWSNVINNNIFEMRNLQKLFPLLIFDDCQWVKMSYMN